MASAGLDVSVSGLCLQFGGHRALDGVSFQAAAGRITGVIGPNGAGKTCLLNCLSGLYRPSAGDMAAGGTPLLGLSPQRRVQLGIGRTFQHAELIADMSALENVMVGADSRRGASAAARARAELELCGLSEAAPAEVATLSYGERKRVDVARALAAEPAVLLLDEPLAGLTPDERNLMESVVQGVRRRGITQLIVEHDVSFVSKVCDYIIVLAHGRMLAEGPPQEALANPVVISAYLGK